jgi:hypothetical protein
MVKYNNKKLFVAYLADNLSYVLLTKDKNLNNGLFKVNLSDLPDYEEYITNKFLKFKKPGSY